MMKRILVEIDDATARALDRVAPARQRRRSAFVRAAIRRALEAEIEERTDAAYRRMPQQPSYFDPAEWEPSEKRATRQRAPTR